MSDYTPTIGLEIHAQLKTQTKMFCDSKNDPEETEPNVNVCPICMGHPGTLPTLNKEAIHKVLLVGVAAEGALADFTEWDRKNYFYPDIPKGYQISQYKYPLVKGGVVSGVALTRIHLEEDTARNVHTKDGSLVDYNRAGIPLMELVTEPVITSAEEAGAFAKELQLLLRYLGVSDANMEKGEMRVEANVSVSKDDKRGTKVEIKNLNSFKSVERGIAYEVRRQEALLEDGEEVVHETRGWDDEKQETFSQRQKEFSEDYRYFPEPDLPKMKLSEISLFSEKTLRGELPELPWERRARLIKEYGLDEKQAAIFVESKVLGDFFEEVVDMLSDASYTSLAINYITSDLIGLLENTDELSIDSNHFAKLIEMIGAGDISSRGAKDILAMMVEEGGDPETIAKENNLLQQSDKGALRKLVDDIIDEHGEQVKEYREGNENVLKFLIGQGMQKTKGSANPQILEKLLKEKLEE